MNIKKFDVKKLNSILISYLSLFLYGFLDNSRGPIFPEMISFFQVSNIKGSLFFSITSLFFMVGSIVTPKILFFRGYKKSFLDQIFLLTLSQMIFFSFSRFEFFLIGSIFMGFSVGVLSVMQNIIVLESSPKEYSDRIINGLHANYGLASLVAPLVISFLFAQGFHFQWIFALNGAFCFVVLVVVKYFDPIYEPKRINIPQFKEVFSKEFFPLAIILSLYVSGEVLISSRLAQFLIQEIKLDHQLSSGLVSGFFAFLFIGRLFFSMVTLRLAIKNIIFFLFLGGIFCIILGLFYSYWFLIVLGFVISPLYALIMLLAKLHYYKFLDQVASLSIFMSGISIIVMNFVVGFLTDRYGIQEAMVLAILFFITSLIIFSFKFMKK